MHSTAGALYFQLWLHITGGPLRHGRMEVEGQQTIWGGAPHSWCGYAGGPFSANAPLTDVLGAPWVVQALNQMLASPSSCHGGCTFEEGAPQGLSQQRGPPRAVELRALMRRRLQLVIRPSGRQSSSSAPKRSGGGPPAADAATAPAGHPLVLHDMA
ncbi:hypothetical protein Esti_003202 [Eimeria stiedai]